MKTWLECVKEAATAEGWITGQDFINAQSENTLDVFNQAAKMYYEQSNSHKHVVMQGLPDSEIYRWLQSKNYQYSYDETQEYRMLFELDFPKIIREFVAEHQGSPTVGKAGGDASVSDGK